MNIICSFDNKYSPYAGVMLASLFENNKDVAITVYALTDYVDDANQQKFYELANNYKQQIFFVNIDINKFRDLPHGGTRFSHIGLGAYYRLLSDVLLPNDVKKALYLDCDIIVNASLKRLYDIDITDVAVCALYDKPDVSSNYSERLGYNGNDGYVNSGVLLINLECWRRMKFSVKTFVPYFSNAIRQLILVTLRDLDPKNIPSSFIFPPGHANPIEDTSLNSNLHSFCRLSIKDFIISMNFLVDFSISIVLSILFNKYILCSNLFS